MILDKMILDEMIQGIVSTQGWKRVRWGRLLTLPLSSSPHTWADPETPKLISIHPQVGTSTCPLQPEYDSDEDFKWRSWQKSSRVGQTPVQSEHKSLPNWLIWCQNNDPKNMIWKIHTCAIWTPVLARFVLERSNNSGDRLEVGRPDREACKYRYIQFLTIKTAKD